MKNRYNVHCHITDYEQNTMNVLHELLRNIVKREASNASVRWVDALISAVTEHSCRLCALVICNVKIIKIIASQIDVACSSLPVQHGFKWSLSLINNYHADPSPSID